MYDLKIVSGKGSNNRPSSPFDRSHRNARNPAWTMKLRVERVLAFLALGLLSPLLGVIALLVRLDSRGPVLFRQERFGLEGRRFEVLKFRTMHAALADPTGGRQTENRDPRITRFGWLLRVSSLDELPQLLNVVRGEMALIGPRAHPCGMRVEGRLCEDLARHYHARHAIPPGITGWAQINGSRGAVKSRGALEERIDLDLDYIRNWSPALDLTIFFRTVVVCLGARGAG